MKFNIYYLQEIIVPYEIRRLYLKGKNYYETSDVTRPTEGKDNR